MYAPNTYSRYKSFILQAQGTSKGCSGRRRGLLWDILIAQLDSMLLYNNVV